MTDLTFDFATLPGPQRYKLLTGLVVPRPIALVTTLGPGGIVNAADGTSSFKPGAFININGVNLATAATADTLPPPTVLSSFKALLGLVAPWVLPSASTSP